MFKQTAISLMLVITTLGFSGIAAAQGNVDTTSQQQTHVHQLVQKLRQNVIKLQEIHAATLKGNPALRKLQQAFVALVRHAIRKKGYDIEASRQRVKSLAKKLESGDLSKKERETLMQEFVAERRSLSKARAVALQQPRIRKASEQLQRTTLAAMKAHSDKVEDLLQDMMRLRQKLHVARLSAAKQ